MITKKTKYSYNTGKYTVIYKRVYYIMSLASFSLTITLLVINSEELAKMFGKTECSNANEKDNNELKFANLD